VIAFVTAGGGFLLAVLWFDLMFDVQVLGHRDRAPTQPFGGRVRANCTPRRTQASRRRHITVIVSYTSTLPPPLRTGQPLASSAAPSRLSDLTTE